MARQTSSLSGLSGLSGLFGLFGLSRCPDREPNQINQTNQINQMNQSDESREKLFPLQVVELVDEPLEFGHCVAALVDGDLLVDGDGHGFDGGAHLVNGVLIGRGACLVGIHDQQGTQFTGDAFRRARLAEEGQQFLLALLLVRGPELLVVGEREAQLANLGLLVFGQGPKPIVEPVDDVVGPLLEPLRCGGLHVLRNFGVVLLQGYFEGAHLAGVDGGEDDAAVGDDPVEEIGAQAIVIGIDPVDVLVRESPFESLPALYEKGFVLRNGFLPVPGQQRREPLGQIAALV